MDTLAKSDAFFFITSVCVSLVTIVILVIGAYLFGIVADIKYIVRKAKASTDEITNDIHEIRETLKDKGSAIGAVLSSFFAFRSRKKRKKESEN